jgi:hypothetical protein
MTDKELLELAAKAAGIWLEWGGETWMPPYHHWNPLTNDGDALRLAVKLKLIVDIGCGYAEARDPEYDPEPIKAMEYLNDHTDPYAATRRAIVRAAAEIGRGME